ncbi:outer membrane protein assembly factor BamE [Curvivirga sp.]|uniref:outer membrane protein assembly factor BamE n=1 Tax=Curvivirga sp. TaxID=2856848 RepID=UPI003B58BC20
MFSKPSDNTYKFAKVVKTSVLTVALVAILSACSPRVSTHGNYPRPEQMELFHIGQANKETFLKVLGPPTTIGTFDSEVWYYMFQEFERFGFFEAELTKMNVIAFRFDEAGIYQEHKAYDLEDIKRISMDDNITPTAGHEISILQQMFGNFGRLN